MLLQTSHRQLPVRCRSSPIASPLPLLLKPSLILFQPCPTILKPTVAVAQQPALTSCSWSTCGNGCVIHDQPPHDTCCVGGCNAKFHHACQTQWEFYQYRLVDPDGPPDKCTYDSMGMKLCPRHHEFSSLVMQPSNNDTSFESTSDFDEPPNTSAPAPNQSAKKTKKKSALTAEEKAKKKEQQLEWAKAMRIENVTLNETKTDVVTLGPATWESLSKEVKSAFMKENGKWYQDSTGIPQHNIAYCLGRMLQIILMRSGIQTV